MKNVYLCIFTFFFVVSLNGQNELFFYLNSNHHDVEFSDYSAMVDRKPAYELTRQIHLNDLAETLNKTEGILSLSLPDGKDARFRFVSADHSSEGYTWYGESISGDGSIIYTKRPAFRTALIQLDGFTYEIVTFKGDKGVIYKFNDRFIESHNCGAIKGSKENDFPTVSLPELNKSNICGETQVRILVLTSPLARSEVSNIIQATNTAYQQLRIALLNSLISERDVSLVLAGIVETDFVETGLAISDVELFP